MPRFSQWRNGFPGLLWSIRQRESRMKLFTHWQLEGVDAPLLLKNASYRKEVVISEDYPLLVEFWDMIHAARPASAIFRIRADDGRRPLMLQGWPGPEEDLYSGFLKAAFFPGGYGAECYKAQLRMNVGDADYPVFTLDMQSHEIREANAAARGLFLGEGQASRTLTLRDAAPDDLGTQLFAAAEKAVKNDAWSGKLMLGNAERGLFSAHARLTPWGGHDGQVVRAALVNVDARQFPITQTEETDKALRPGGLRVAMEALYAQCGPEVDGMLLSHIQSNRGRVAVFGVGSAFKDLEWGALHAYEGTIAQDIERFGLSYLLVEDTQDSVKSIDWALFAPLGVRSYYAKPFYDEHGLLAVLILVSHRTKTFGPGADSHYADIDAAFGRLLQRWQPRPETP